MAAETVGSWYSIVGEIEAAGCLPKLVHARKAKLMMGEINKTDKLDVRGLNRTEQHAANGLDSARRVVGPARFAAHPDGVRPVVPQLKSRIHATLAKYALRDLEVSDLCGVRGRGLLRARFELLPPHTAYASQQLLAHVEALGRQVRAFEG